MERARSRRSSATLWALVALVIGIGAEVLDAQDLSPGPRYGATLTYDAVRKQVVLFGGYAATSLGGEGTYPSDLWAWNGERWQRLSGESAPHPPGREYAQMEYDAARDRIVLFSGRRKSAMRDAEILSDVWEWDGARWKEFADAGYPQLLHAVTAYDPSRQRVLAYGGLGASGFSYSIRAWNGNTWIVLDSAGPANLFPAAASVSATGELSVMLASPSGNNASSSRPSETWTWKGSWHQAEQGPPFANLQAAASTGDGGWYFYQSNEGWLSEPVLHLRNARGDWRHWPVRTGPHAITSSAAFDVTRKRFVVFGGRLGSQIVADLWEFDGREWIKR